MIDSLKKQFGEINASESSLNRLVYSSDASMIEGRAKAVVFPKDFEDLQKLVRLAKRFDIGLMPRGAGTNVVGACVPEGHIVVDMCKINQLIDYGPNFVIVGAGMILEDLNNMLKKKFLPIEMDNDACTIGGMIAMNAMSNRVKQYGRMEDWVEEMEVIDGSGKYELIKGDRLKHFVGKEGSTGFIVTAKLKVIERPFLKPLNIMSFNTITSTIEMVDSLLKDPNVTYIEYFDEELSEAMDLGNKCHLLVEYDNDEGKIKDMEEIAEIWELRKNLDSHMKTLGYIECEMFQLEFENMDKYLYWLRKRQVPTMALFSPNVVTSYFRKREMRKEEIMKTAESVKAKMNYLGTGMKYKNYLTAEEKEGYKELKKYYDLKDLMNRGMKV
jgi:glycolate oxidase